MASISKSLDDCRLDAVVNYEPRYSVSIALDKRYPHDLQPKQRWERIMALGKGSYGNVWLEELREGPSIGYKWRAVKSIPKSFMINEKEKEREIEAMTEFSRMKYEFTGNFVRFYGWFEDFHNVHLAMEYFPHGTLNDHITREMPEPEIRLITVQLLAGLDSMHRSDFGHRDLKPENIFVSSPGPLWSVKIGDFGVSKRTPIGETAHRTMIGSALYMAPEVGGYVDLGTEESDEYTHIVDLWSLGCVVYELAASQPLIEDWHTNYIRLALGKWYPKKPPHLSQMCWDFITKLLVRHPAGRLNAAQALLHEWILTEPPKALEGIGVTAPAAKNIVGIENEEASHTIRPVRPATPDKAKAEPQVYGRSMARAKNMQWPSGNVADANTIIGKVNDLNSHKGVTVNGKDQRMSSPFMTMVADPSHIVPATENHSQVDDLHGSPPLNAMTSTGEINEQFVSDGATDPSDHLESLDTLPVEHSQNRTEPKKRAEIKSPALAPRLDAVNSGSSKKSSIGEEVADSNNSQILGNLFSQELKAQRNPPRPRLSRQRQQVSNTNNQSNDEDGRDDSVTLSALPTQYVIWPGSNSHPDRSGANIENSADNRYPDTSSLSEEQPNVPRTSSNSSWYLNDGSLRHTLTNLFDEPDEPAYSLQKAQDISQTWRKKKDKKAGAKRSTLFG